MAGARRLPSGSCQGWYHDWEGKRVYFLGTHDLKDTKAVARQKEDKERLIKQGFLPRPKPSDKPRPVADLVRDYLSWGRSQGGHGGRPWSKPVASKHAQRLDFWRTRLNIETIADIRLPLVEGALQELQKKGRIPHDPRRRKQCIKPFSGKTLNHYRESLCAFLRWCKSRNYVEQHPLEGLAEFDETPAYERRAPTLDELRRILDAAETMDTAKDAPKWVREHWKTKGLGEPNPRLAVEVLLSTGYRRGELKALRVADLDAAACSLNLAAANCKGRKDSRQPISPALAEKLAAHVAGRAPTAPLLNLPNDPVRWLYRAMRAADPEVKVWGPGGKLDLHSLRVAYTTMVIESGANIKEVQKLARHASSATTMKVYAKARDNRLSDLGEKVGEMIGLKKCAPGVHAVAVGAELLDVTAANEQINNPKTVASKCGSNPRRDAILVHGNSSTESRQPSTLQSFTPRGNDGASTRPQRVHNNLTHKKCAAGVHAPPGANLHALKWRVISRLDSVRGMD